MKRKLKPEDITRFLSRVDDLMPETPEEQKKTVEKPVDHSMAPAIHRSDIPDGGVVTVACKLPHGIVLRVFKMEEVSEAINNGVGYRTVKLARQVPGEFVIKGNAVAVDKSVKYPIVGGFALTHNVPASLFKAWMNQNKDSDLVKSGLIFAYEKSTMAEGASEERAGLRSGLEPMQSEGRDPRAPKGIQKDDGTAGERRAA